jgi:hypothetical protein
LFYLFALAVVIVLFTVISKYVPFYVLPIVIIGGLLTVSVIGAFQLRQDERLSDKNFLKLMFETFKYFKLVKPKD